MNAAYLAIVVGLIMLTYGCITTQPPANGTSAPPIITNATPILNTTNSSNPPHINLTALTKESCEAARGHWNPCGSACRGEPPGTPCIQVCFAYCECGGIAGFGCP
jgi:hypothetical protein